MKKKQRVRLRERENKRREFTTRRRERAQSIVDFDRRLSLSSCKKKKKKKSLSLCSSLREGRKMYCTVLYTVLCNVHQDKRASPATPVTGSSYKEEKETQYSTCITDQPSQPSRTSPPAHTVRLSLRSVVRSFGRFTVSFISLICYGFLFRSCSTYTLCHKSQ